jgi:hypothetical protein
MTDLPDRDDRDLLVRSYVDGELDATERATFEADPELVAEAGAQQQIRRLLREPLEVDAAQKERVIAAALAVFATGSAEAPAAPPPASLAARRRHRWLTAAAAAVAVAFAGAVLVLGQNRADDQPAAQNESAARDETATFGATDGSLTVQQDAGGATAAEAPATVAAPEAAEEATAAGQAAPATLTRLTSPDELATFAAGALANRAATAATAAIGADATDAGAAGSRPCRDDVIAFAEVELAGEVRTVAVRVDSSTDEAIALDAATCEVVLRAPMP